MVTARSSWPTRDEALAEAARLNADAWRGFRYFVEPPQGDDGYDLSNGSEKELANIRAMLGEGAQ